MSDNIKLIIEIPEEDYKKLVNPYQHNEIWCERLKRIVINGTPLDSNDSDYAETQAYFAGEAYGWEQGRKALIEDVKTEIKEKSMWYRGQTYDGLCIALKILDKYIDMYNCSSDKNNC